MDRKKYILLLMYLAWPVNLIHRYWNNRPVVNISPFSFEVQSLSVQWYIYGLLGSISWIMIFWAIWLYITGSYRQDRDFRTIFGAYFIIVGIDLPHYLFWFKRCEWIMAIEGLIVFGAALLTLYRGYKKRKKCAGS